MQMLNICSESVNADCYIRIIHWIHESQCGNVVFLLINLLNDSSWKISLCSDFPEC